MNSKFGLVCLWLLITAACCALPGCNRSDQPSTYPVRGLVLYKNKPVAGASITFLALGAPRPAVATTDEAGNFQLTTFEPNDGAVPGTHEVTVKKYTTDPPPMPSATADAEVDPVAVEKYNVEMLRWRESAKFAVPKKYTDRTTTDLWFEVTEGDNDFKIQLTD